MSLPVLASVLLPYLPLALLLNFSIPLSLCMTACSLRWSFRIAPLSRSQILGFSISVDFRPLSTFSISNTHTFSDIRIPSSAFLTRKKCLSQDYGRGHKSEGIFQEDPVGEGSEWWGPRGIENTRGSSPKGLKWGVRSSLGEPEDKKGGGRRPVLRKGVGGPRELEFLE